jgi:hypothetical protein
LPGDDKNSTLVRTMLIFTVAVADCSTSCAVVLHVHQFLTAMSSFVA